MKTVCVTGASRGIGFEIVKSFLSLKDTYVIALSRNVAPLRQLECANLNVLSFDLTKDDYSLLPTLFETTQALDILINNAGLLINKPFDALSEEDWQRMIDVNLLAPANLIKILLPKLQLSTRAHVVNISSMGGFQGASKFKGLSGYSATKAALGCLTESLAEEYKEESICFNCLSLGAVNTTMLNAAFPNYQAPLEAHEMAQFICDFASNGHRFFNGKNLPVALHNPT